MQEKDKAQKMLEQYADVFADIVNVLLFEGKTTVRPEDLRESLKTSLYRQGGKLYSMERDAAGSEAISAWSPSSSPDCARRGEAAGRSPTCLYRNWPTSWKS